MHSLRYVLAKLCSQDICYYRFINARIFIIKVNVFPSIHVLHFIHIDLQQHTNFSWIFFFFKIGIIWKSAFEYKNWLKNEWKLSTIIRCVYHIQFAFLYCHMPMKIKTYNYREIHMYTCRTSITSDILYESK